ncbi:MAG: T9SS type A sorting domain-containing protein [Candidatus Neomarinimicrobiota bacterium]
MKKIFSIIIILITMSFSLFAQTWKNILSDYCIVKIEKYESGYWFGTDRNGAFRYDANESKWYFYRASNGYMTTNDDINDMIIANKRVWFATNYGIYSCKLDGSDWDHDILPGDVYSNWVRGLSANSDSLFVASFTGLLTKPFSRNSYKVHANLKPGYYQTSLTRSVSASDSIVWIGTEDGVFKYDVTIPISDPSSHTYYSKSNAFDSASEILMCNSMYQSHHGVWIGLEEYTPDTNPDYCLGGLFHYNGKTWTKYDESLGLPADGIHFIKEYDNKIYAGLFHYVNGVNFDGAGLLVLDLQDSSWQVLDKENWHIGSDAVRSFYCTENDTIVGTDKGLYTNKSTLPGLPPYETASWFSLKNLGNGELEVRVDSVYRADEYELYRSLDGVNFTDTLHIFSECDTLKNLPTGKTYYFKIAGKNEYGRAPQCKDILGVTLSDSPNSILIVQAYDMAIVSNTYDYCVNHGEAISHAGLGFDAMSDEAIYETDLMAYKMIDWIAGLDKNVFTFRERNFIRAYLEAGGKLFMNGAEIQENVYSVERDAAFYSTYLKAKWKVRDTQTYSIESLASGIFNGIGKVNFDNGKHGIYKVYKPDGFKPTGGAEACLLYSEKDSSSYGSAALQYTGTFAESLNEAQLVYMGFPFETIYPDSLRNAVMKCILSYFDYPVTLTSTDDIASPQDFVLEQNYPNPFNPTTVIGYSLMSIDKVDLSVFDINGRKVETLVSGLQFSGYYKINWDASNYSSGLYVYRLQVGNNVMTKKMLLMK